MYSAQCVRGSKEDVIVYYITRENCVCEMRKCVCVRQKVHTQDPNNSAI